MVSKHLGSYIYAMHNLYVNFVKILDICKDFSKDLVNDPEIYPAEVLYSQCQWVMK